MCNDRTPDYEIEDPLKRAKNLVENCDGLERAKEHEHRRINHTPHLLLQSSETPKGSVYRGVISELLEKGFVVSDIYGSIGCFSITPIEIDKREVEVSRTERRFKMSESY